MKWHRLQSVILVDLTHKLNHSLLEALIKFAKRQF